MDKREFEKLVQKIKIRNPKMFGLDSDCKPNIQDIVIMEKYYNIVFAESYKNFLLQYGGGYFAFSVVYSLDLKSPFYVKNNVMPEFVNTNKFFPVIDFETGDLAGFKIKNRVCEEFISLYSHDDKVIIDTNIDFYSALVKYGLKNA